jgi:hypothetical protein
MTDTIDFRFHSDRYGRIASIERNAADAFRLTTRGLVGRDARLFFRKRRDALTLALRDLAVTGAPQYLEDLSFHPREAKGRPVHLTLTEIEPDYVEWSIGSGPTIPEADPVSGRTGAA